MGNGSRVALAEIKCAARTIGLLLTGRLRLPRALVGRQVAFADGTTSRVYRVTTLTRQETHEPVVLVVRFRLRLLGDSRLGHAMFRRESVLNTPLFAGHSGFRVKLWLTDHDTGFYRGVYQWDGLRSAEEYASVIETVLGPFCQPGTIDHVAISNTRLNDFTSAEWRPIEETAVPPWSLPRRTGVTTG